jgi:aspartate/methionine/tyrosine aminotransferase
MKSEQRLVASTYLEWAKLHSAAKYNLASSGIAGFPLSGLPLSLQDLEINGPTVYGYEPLLERLALKCGVTPDCVVMATGTAMANHLAMAAILNPGDQVLVEAPTYGPLFEVVSYLQARIHRFHRRAENDFRVDPDEIARTLTPNTRLIVLSNLHNPSGALIEEETLVRIGELAAKVGAYVLVDEVYLDTLFDHPVRSSFHLGDNFVVTTSLTKAYGLSGLRCGWILAEPALAHRIWRLWDLFEGSPVHAAELLSVIALDHLDKIGARAKQILDTNRKALNAFFAGRTDVGGFIGQYGTVAFPALKRGSVNELFALLQSKYETSFVPGEFFEMPNHFRIGIGGDPAMTAQGLHRLGLALDEYSATVA